MMIASERDKQNVTVVSKSTAMSPPDSSPDCPADCPWLNFPVNEMPSRLGVGFHGLFGC